PSYPAPDRLWDIVDRHNVSTFYTSPTLIRSLMSAGNEYLTSSNRNSLKLLGSVGEPINPAAWNWYHKFIGNSRCPIVDTWWQTETGGIMISPLPGIELQKPGAASLPFFGIKPKLTSNNHLIFESSWPGQARTIYNNHDRFVQTYFSQYPGYYFSGDGATIDQDGYYWITGRVD
ncbi:MAG: AMP-binding protein, partial [Nanoarchaeota archaeon]|nr:AMP-binding protein [Nanoarchaeota archaeon]